MRIKALAMIMLVLMTFSPSIAQYTPAGPVFPVSGGGGTTLTLVQHKVFDQLSTASSVAITVTATAAGNANVVCFTNVNTAVTISSVVDNATGGSNTYTNRTASNASAAGAFVSGCYDSLNTAHGGATLITITFSASSGYQMITFDEGHRTSGSWAFDVANNVSTGTSVGTAITGPALIMTGSPGFAVATVSVNNGPITANPTGGNNFTAGGDISSVGGNGVVSLIATTATTNTPAWTDGSSADLFCSSAVAYK